MLSSGNWDFRTEEEQWYWEKQQVSGLPRAENCTSTAVHFWSFCSSEQPWMWATQLHLRYLGQSWFLAEKAGRARQRTSVRNLLPFCTEAMHVSYSSWELAESKCHISFFEELAIVLRGNWVKPALRWGYWRAEQMWKGTSIINKAICLSQIRAACPLFPSNFLLFQKRK